MRKILLVALFSVLVISTAAHAQNSFLSVIQSALSSLNSGNYTDANKEFAKALELATTDEDKALALNELGLCYMLQGNPSQARVEAHKVIALKNIKPETLAKAYNVAWISYVGEKKYTQARDELEKILTIKGISQQIITETTQQIGESYLQGKRYSDAITIFLKVLSDKSAPDILKMAAQMGIGRAYLGETNFEKARIEFSNVLEYDEANMLAPEKRIVPIFRANAYLLTGESYFDEKEYQKAEDAYKKALQVKGVSEGTVAKIKAELTRNKQAMADQKEK